MGAVPDAHPQPLYVRIGHTSRRRHHGSSRTERSEENPQRVEKLMAAQRERVVVIGAGHNGLVAAFYLAKAGFPTLVLERRHVIAGTAVTEEIHPGFRCPTVLHSPGHLLPQIARDMQLDKPGLITKR